MSRVFFLFLAVLLICSGCGTTPGETAASDTSSEAVFSEDPDIINPPDISDKRELIVTKGFSVWNFSNGTEGFASAENSASAYENGVLIWIAAEGRLLSPENLAIPTDTVQTIELRLYSTKAESLTLYWAESGAEFDPARSVCISIPADGKWHDCQIELGQNPAWTGEISRLAFEASGGQIGFDFIRATGIYFVPFPAISGNFDFDMWVLGQIKETFADKGPSVILGFSYLVEYLSETDGKGNYLYNSTAGEEGAHNPHYILKLAKASDMPVMLWLRGDPWGYCQSGAYGELFSDNNNLMWTAAADGTAPYRNSESGYSYLCLAQTELSGETSDYWVKTDKLLGQCASAIAVLIRDNPDDILGVTTTSEYKYYDNINNEILDYNPKTIAEFRNYCMEKYGTVDALNGACGTSFSTWKLLSSDYNPSTVENPGGFDAPRTKGRPLAFWKEWRTFRYELLYKAVARQVEIISGAGIDGKWIYTHQVSEPGDLMASPSSCGNVPASNAGIDFFNTDINKTTMEEVSSFVRGDASRSWGVPEWLITENGDYSSVSRALSFMKSYGVKYICPFCWGFGGVFDFTKSAGAMDALKNFVKNPSGS